ncbi:4-(cytidine 5'-diphospho)-2-C-methyl-D-erythritol kinase [Allosphingosinicella vermicomposti]|uniref:GHMP family kinase ATP-binding protein n=1 Tax=Allosphingosinicella vermicomposti TaxID=614671 RepID=UPI000D109F31|nr:4-(cytidine 5'-diphospho)-2-C-methyl-D-erythritol kinase [Allosphingosinicella vermicomposti]
MEETAYAKLNLALHVRAREPDGYHRIETLFAFCADGDRLRVEEGEGEITLRITGPFAEGLSAGEDNLVLRAASALAERFGIDKAKNGAALTLEKNLPVASGIGGGSADAAAALRLLARWWGITDAPQTSEATDLPDTSQTTAMRALAPYKGRPYKASYRKASDGLAAGEQGVLPTWAAIDEIARRLGADVPACLAFRTARGDGRGDQLRPVDLGLAGTPVLLVNPRTAVSTAAVFNGWDGVDKGPMPGDPKAGRNDLQAPACAVAPEIEAVLAALSAQPGATLIHMSGSGATCFALFEDEEARDAAATAIRDAHPDWWKLSSRLI